jgi:L-fuconate dehydratase
MFDYVAVSGSLDGRMIEWIDHLHEHFHDPAVVRGGRYVAPTAPGSSAAILPGTIAGFSFPDGPAWRDGQLVAAGTVDASADGGRRGAHG